MKKALLIIDAQNDYLSTGKYPLWNIEQTLENISERIKTAKQENHLIIFIQHLSPKGGAFFEEDSKGADIVPSLLELVDEPTLISKCYASAFNQTSLNELLSTHHIDTLDIMGMMTQNCVLFTAISEEAKQYHINIISDCCTSVDKIIHAVAVRGLSQIESINVI